MTTPGLEPGTSTSNFHDFNFQLPTSTVSTSNFHGFFNFHGSVEVGLHRGRNFPYGGGGVRRGRGSTTFQKGSSIRSQKM